jgi:hypothetical protein
MNSRYLQSVVQKDMAQDTAPDHIYMDLNIINNDFGTRPPIPLTYSETRDRPIIQNCSEYYVSIIRFHLDTLNLPVFIPQIQIGQSDVNLSIYSFSMAKGDVVFRQYLEFVPQNTTAAAPKAPTTQMDLSTDYYNIQSFQWLVDLLNNTLDSCYTGFLAALADAEEDAPATNNIPFFMYDPSSSELILNVDVLSFGAAENPCLLYCNTPMRNLLSGFNMSINSYTDADGKNFQFIVENRFNTNLLQISDTYSAIQCYQEYNSTSTWAAVSSIVLTTTMPIVPTIQGIPQVFGNATTMTNTSANFSVNVISDFEVSLNSGKEWLPSVNYVPSIYRLIPMTSNNPLHEVNITAYWRDIYSNLHEFKIGSNSNCNIKLLFRKKYLGV